MAMRAIGIGCVAIGLLLGGSALAHAADDPLDPLFASLQAIAKSDAEKAKPEPAPGAPSNPEPSAPRFTPAILSFLPGIRQSIAQGNYDNALANASQLANVDPSDEFQKQVQALIALLQKMRDADEAQFNARIDHALAEATRVILTAKTPKEFDAPLTELIAVRDLSGNNGYWNQRRQTSSRKLENAIQYVRWWQDYVSQLSLGHDDRARDSLRNIANNDFSFNPIPRSELLLRVEAPPMKVATTDGATLARQALDQILAATKGLEDVPQTATALRDYQRTYHDDTVNQALGDLEGVGRAYREFQLGRYGVALQQVHVNNLNSGPLDLLVRSLQRRMVLEVMGKTLNVKDLSPVKDDESIADYLLRLAVECQKAARWDDLRRVLDTYRQVVYYGSNQPEWLRDDLDSLNAYRVGLVQEKAGQIDDALRSYRKSLATLGTYFPSAVPADALAALQKKFPDAGKAPPG